MKKLPTWIEADEYGKLIKHTLSRHHKLAFMLGFQSGLRVSEMVDLKPENVDLERKSIMIRNSKGGRDRVVPLPKHWRNDYIKMLPFKCGRRSLQKAFDSAAKRSGLKKIKPNMSIHKLRHGFAKRLIDQGVPLNQVQLLMGHSAASTTSVYIHANPKDALDKYQEVF